MEKIIKEIILVFICCCLCGCMWSNDEKRNYDNIIEGTESMVNDMQKIIVSYEKDVKTQIEIAINLQTGKRVKSIITDTIEESEDTYSNTVELETLISEKILSSMNENKKQSLSDDQKVIWSVKVRYKNSNEMFYQYGFEEYPEYWGELIEMIEK